MKTEEYTDPAAFAAAVRRAQRQTTKQRRPAERPTLPRAEIERSRRTKLSMKRAQALGWQFGYVAELGHYAWKIGSGRRVGYEDTREALLDALYEAGER